MAADRSRPDYGRRASHLESVHESLREFIEAGGDGEKADPWGRLPDRQREEAEAAAHELALRTRDRYRQFVDPKVGPGRDLAWEKFQQWRDEVWEQISMEVFGDQFPQLAMPVTNDFEEDLKAHRAHRDAELRIAEESGALPKQAAVMDPIFRASATRRIGPPFAEQYRVALEKCGWKWVFHTTRLENLPNIAVDGIQPGIDAATYLPDSVERDSRSQSDDEKEFWAARSVCSAFWPQDWVCQRFDGEQHSVILALDAEAVCLKKGTTFFGQATRSSEISVQDHLENQNGTAAGFAAFQACWDTDKPLSRGYGPRPTNHEIYSRLVLPAEIRMAIFPSEIARDRWFPGFIDTARENYGEAVDVKAEVGCVWDSGRPFGFRSARGARNSRGR